MSGGQKPRGSDVKDRLPGQIGYRERNHMSKQNYHLGFTGVFIAKLEIPQYDPSLK
jgi:hypothetical protein